MDEIAESPLTCIYSSNNIDFEELETLENYDEGYHYFLANAYINDHEHWCIIHSCYELNEDESVLNGSICDCYEGEGQIWYSDVPPTFYNNNLNFPNAKIIMKYSRENNVLQLLLSPETHYRKMCSPCYPCQADAYAVSDDKYGYLCYKLPEKYLYESD